LEAGDPIDGELAEWRLGSEGIEEGEETADEIEQGIGQIGVGEAGGFEGDDEVTLFGERERGAGWGEVSAIDGEPGDDACEGESELGEGIVASVAVLSGEGLELAGEGIEFRGEGSSEDEEFVVEDFGIETGMVAGESAMDTVEGAFVA
jgi:hypothetical protein